MTREQLEHIIRAAASISEDDDIVVFGSQAILGQFSDPPPALTVSMEADVFPRNKPDRSDLIDGSIGEGSPFHATFGYYAQGIDIGTATLPAGWQERLVPIRNANTRGHVGWCLEIHDLLISKCVAGRPKDLRFLRAALEAGLATETVLLQRLEQTPVEGPIRQQVEGLIRGARRRSDEGSQHRPS